MTIANAITYLPFGGIESMSYGNGVALTNSYNNAYQLTAKQHGTLFNHSYSYDAAGNITATSADSYAYDDLYRLTSENTDSYSYDAIGNRLSFNGDSYAYPSSSSILSSINGGSITTDAGGYITQDANHSYGFNDAGQLESIGSAPTYTATYTYNANNQRTRKNVGGVVTHYVYGRGGLLYGEYDALGNVVREYIWLGSEPIAQIEANGDITYLHTDHLGTPRVASNAAGAQVWNWDSDAFGVGSPSGSATVNLRFAGQYYDAESNLHYNWNRYYNPTTGRYISSDPIGLAGGINTFGYVSANPVMFIDPEGLLTVAEALKHYFGGSGRNLKAAFSDIDTSGLSVVDFSQVEEEILLCSGGTCDLSVLIDDRTAYTTSGDDFLIFGNITLRLKGKLSICSSGWEFSGLLKPYYDVYDFNKSTHRSLIGEALTGFGSFLPGKGFTIEILGAKYIEESGTL